MSRRILVIDDEPAICQIMRDLFADVCVDVDTAGDGREGLTKLTTNRYDVVLTDYFMPGLSGLRLFDRIREIAPDVPVVLLTGSALIADSVPGEVVVLKKPIALQELLDCLGRWLEPLVPTERTP
jgi:CheY-like chemotaxis protein